MVGIADFLDSLIGGFDLICFCLAIGGLFWGMFILRPWQQHRGYNGELLEKTIALIYKGGFWLATAQLFKIILKIWLMFALLNRWPFPEFASTTQFIGGIVRTLFVLILAGYCYFYLRNNHGSKQHWLTANLVALPMIISGAWLVHG
ncbi:MAG: copper resistance protein, partial [Methyloglobulus sp.]|nr:copper resistance protein [Methyloglobulus sp.]